MVTTAIAVPLYVVVSYVGMPGEPAYLPGACVHTPPRTGLGPALRTAVVRPGCRRREGARNMAQGPPPS
ncbi:MAG: hypothetical protein WCG47_10530 [Dermatophilaceae bacterium]